VDARAHPRHWVRRRTLLIFFQSSRILHAPQRSHVHLEAAQPCHLCQVEQPARRVDRVCEEATGGAAV